MLWAHRLSSRQSRTGRAARITDIRRRRLRQPPRRIRNTIPAVCQRSSPTPTISPLSLPCAINKSMPPAGVGRAKAQRCPTSSLYPRPLGRSVPPAHAVSHARPLACRLREVAVHQEIGQREHLEGRAVAGAEAHAVGRGLTQPVLLVRRPLTAQRGGRDQGDVDTVLPV